MALQKSIDTAHGVMAEYHKIVRVNDDRLRKSTEVLVNVYKDAACKTKQPLESWCFVFSESPDADGAYFLEPEQVNPDNTNHINLAYTAIKSLPSYEGAIDV